MKRWLIFLASILLATAVVAQVVQSQPLTVVQGQLKDQQGAPLAYQAIVIEAKGWPEYRWWGKQPKVKALTDEKGVFQVIDLPAGKKYEVKALKPGSEPVAIGSFETPYAYRKLDISDQLNKIMGAPVPEVNPK